MNANLHPIFMVKDVLRVITNLLDVSDVHTLRTVRPFREVALDLLYHDCSRVKQWLGAVCNDRTLLPNSGNHSGCVVSRVFSVRYV